MPAPDRDWEGVRLHVVTGKGGTGKTTVAAALALALAGGGHRVLLVEVEGRQGIAQLFDVPPLPYEERKVAVGRGGGEVFGAGGRRRGRAAGVPPAVLQARPRRPGARAVRRRRLRHDHRARHARRPADRQGLRGRPPPRGASEASAPAAEPPRRTTRSCSTRRRPAGSPASSTSTPRSPGWPRSARSATRPTRSCGCCARRRPSVHVVTLLEEMPVQETVDAVGGAGGARPAGRRRRGQRGPRAAAAGARPHRRRGRARSTAREVAAGLAAAGLPADRRPWSTGCSTEAAEHAERVAPGEARAEPGSRPPGGRRTSCRC